MKRKHLKVINSQIDSLDAIISSNVPFYSEKTEAMLSRADEIEENIVKWGWDKE